MSHPTPICITYAGETRTLRQWADSLATVMDEPPSVSILYDRYRRGWSPERILTTPALRPEDRHTAFATAVARYLATQEENTPCRHI